MQDIVNALLSLSRCESGMQALEATPVDVAELLNEVRGMFDEALRSKKINLAWAIDPAAQVKTDRAMLSAVLTNLFKNAIDYTPAAGGITCRADHADEGIVVRLANTNHDLIAEDIPHLFEPLWRKDKARTGCSHCGLGLAVAERFSNLLGIGLSATLPEPGWFEIILTIPLAVSNGVPPPRSAE
jgi:two-component system sensor histidine kinase QseC